ncbi:pyridoxamine 5'-phosphate oxidase family protein [Microbacterium sp.]|uniref:pyridoxamine 5'-phosphate oxidase family protein n=1 Tax=Microbacterium sp. TaxID=51671 RepID=UPI003A920C16
MDNTHGPVVALSVAESWTLLRTQQLGRLITNVGERIDVFPVNFVIDADQILFRTAEGSKLVELTINDEVLFEADDHTDTHAWSVIVRGTARRLETDAEVQHADSLGLAPWIPTLKTNYVSIAAKSVTGRAFRLEEEPARDGVQLY